MVPRPVLSLDRKPEEDFLAVGQLRLDLVGEGPRVVFQLLHEILDKGQDDERAGLEGFVVARRVPYATVEKQDRPGGCAGWNGAALVGW